MNDKTTNVEVLENDEATETALAKATANTQIKIMDLTDLDAGFDLQALSGAEQLEVMREIQEAFQQVEMLAIPSMRSKDVLDIPITILDAVSRAIPVVENGVQTLKNCVNFVLKNDETGEKFTVLKGSNTFNDSYVSYFDKIRGLFDKPLTGYVFQVDERYSKAGNPAIVLRKLQAAKAKK